MSFGVFFSHQDWRSMYCSGCWVFYFEIFKSHAHSTFIHIMHNLSVLRIHDILGWIRIRILGSMPLTNGSGFGSGSWIRVLLFSSWTFEMPAKKNLFFNTIFSTYYFLNRNLHHFSKIKSQKEYQKSRNQGFSYNF
jgi:hypothetical protein